MRHPRTPVIVAHRGASGYLPEHTLEAYGLAIDQGADFIEPDLVVTRDGRLVVRHEPNLIQTTDVAARPEFAHLRRRATVDGVEEEGWFACDFTLAEIRTLRAVQALPERPRQFDGRYLVPTFDEVLRLARSRSRSPGRTVGVYPELKHPAWHRALGLPLEEKAAAALKQAGWARRTAPVIVQCFEPSALRRMRALTRVRLMQLIDAPRPAADGTLRPAAPWDWQAAGDRRTFNDMLAPAGLAAVRGWADGIGPWKGFVLRLGPVDQDGNGRPDDLDGDGRLGEADLRVGKATGLVQAAHAAGLFVHPWTFRSEPHRLAADFGRDPLKEYLAFFAAGVDGVFSDFPDTAFTARELWRLAKG